MSKANFEEFETKIDRELLNKVINDTRNISDYDPQGFVVRTNYGIDYSFWFDLENGRTIDSVMVVGKNPLFVLAAAITLNLGNEFKIEDDLDDEGDYGITVNCKGMNRILTDEQIIVLGTSDIKDEIVSNMSKLIKKSELKEGSDEFRELLCTITPLLC